MTNSKMPFWARNLPQAATRDWYRIRAEGESHEDNSADLYIYDAIDSWFGVSAETLVQDLAGLDVQQLNVFINSPGGSVFDGLAILNALRRHKAHVTVTVDGLAASAASFIAMGGDEIVMSRNAEMMVHDASGLCIGNAGDMATMADDLTRISDNLASIYAERAGGDVKAWRDVMLAETWYTAQEAVDAGLADRVDSGKDGEKAKAKFDLGVFAHAGRADAPSPYIPRPAPAAAVRPAELSVTPEKEGTDMSDLIKGLRNRIGIAEDAELNDTQVLAALDEALAERAEPQEPAARELPEGTEVIDSAALEELRAEAEAGRAARAEQDTARRAQIVDDAIKAGKFGPARRDAWLNALEVDEAGATADLDRLTAGLVPVAQIGDAGDAVDGDDELYNRAFGAPQKDVK